MDATICKVVIAIIVNTKNAEREILIYFDIIVQKHRHINIIQKVQLPAL